MMVSVVMCTFNEPPGVVSAAIESILAQTHRELELLVLDDSNLEQTRQAIDRLAATDERVHVVRRKERMGFVHALNVGLGLARGEYIARMDSDDIAVPERLEWQQAFFVEHPLADVVGGAMDIINEQGEVTSHRDYPGGMRLRLFSMLRTPLAHPTVMMRRRVIDKGFRYDESFEKAEDLDLWLRLIKVGCRLDNMPQTLLRYRVVGDLAVKRNREQFRWSLRARLRNFSWRHPLWSLGAVIVAIMYRFTPRHIVSAVYRRENRR